jgi:hypothetical protein
MGVDAFSRVFPLFPRFSAFPRPRFFRVSPAAFFPHFWKKKL